MTRAILVVAMCVAMMSVACGRDNGIIILEGYEHGVVICGEALIVNTGHYNDDEVDELIALAEKECPK